MAVGDNLPPVVAHPAEAHPAEAHPAEAHPVEANPVEANHPVEVPAPVASAGLPASPPAGAVAALALRPLPPECRPVTNPAAEPRP